MLYNHHKDDDGPAKSICRSLVKCQRCHRVVTRASLNDHHCGKVRRSTCKKHVKPEGHQCFLQPVETLQPKQRRGNDILDDDVEVENDVTEHECNLIFFDFGCLQECICGYI